jgi:hypothetical protein
MEAGGGISESPQIAIHVERQKEAIMKRSVIIGVMVACIIAAAASAQEPLWINYQGYLTASSGNPVPNDLYYLTFRLYPDSTTVGNQLWSETQPAVQTMDGLFQVHLGSSNPLSLATLGQEPKFLEITVGGEILAPRTRLTTVSEAAYARELKGDIVTEPGSFVFRSATGDSAVQFSSDGLSNAIALHHMEPLDLPPAFEVGNYLDGMTSLIMRDNNGYDAFNLNSNGIANSFHLNWMEPLDLPALAFSSNLDFVSQLSLFQHNGEPAVEMMTDGLSNSFHINWMEPLESPAVEISSGIGGEASMVMFNPQPEPPATPLLAMNTSIGGQASLVMFNPQPEPPGDEPLLEMMTDMNGVNMNMYAPQMGRSVANSIHIAAGDSGGSMQFYDELGTHIWLSIDPDGAEGNMTFYNSDATPTVNISSLGRVGIGTANPHDMLQVGVGDEAAIRVGNSPQMMLSRDVANNRFRIQLTGVNYLGKVLQIGRDDQTHNIALMGNVGIGTDNPARKLHISDVLRLEPRTSFPSNPGTGDICVVLSGGSSHIYCYLNGDWRQLD